jgi:hypothetical protein
MNSATIKNLQSWGFAFCGAVILSGCSSIGVQHQSAGIAFHISRPITASPNAQLPPPTSSLFTYVLGPNKDTASQAGVLAHDALKTLLAETQRVPVAPGTQGPYYIPIKNLNQFLIPAKVPLKDQPVPIEEYDLTLSEGYISTFKLALIDKPDMISRLGGYGPFLLATLQPIGEIVQVSSNGEAYLLSNAPILLMDLSGYQASSIPAAVQVYKDAVITLPNTTSIVQSYKVRIADLAKRINAAIPEVFAAKSKFVRTAMQSQQE